MIQVDPLKLILALGLLFGVGYALGWCNGWAEVFECLKDNREDK